MGREEEKNTGVDQTADWGGLSVLYCIYSVECRVRRLSIYCIRKGVQDHTNPVEELKKRQPGLNTGH